MNYLDDFTKMALKEFGHEGSAEHYRRLKEDGELCGTRCAECDEVSFPGRSHCPFCFHDEVSWEPIGKGARLFAFTTQTRGLRFRKPSVIGIVEVPFVGLVVTPLGGTMDTLEIGQAMVPEVIDAGDGLVIHRFVPG